MKKLFLLIVLIFQSAFVFGQYGANKDCAESGCGDKSQNITRCWGVVRTFDQGIQIRVKGPVENCYNAINSESNRHSFMWHIEISGLKGVKQDCKLYVTGGDNRKSDYMIGSNTDGTILTDKRTVDFFTFSNDETIGLEIIPFGNTSTNKNATQQAQPQNDLTEYNRSKEDLERQIAEKNAEGQQKSQNYTAAMNAGISAHNSGNYDEAKRQFSIALNNCNTDEARNKAQEYYNKTINAEKSQAKIKAVGDLTNATINLVSYFANRKNALRNSLSQEDAQALIDIVNSENPDDYTQNIIQIFTDLGYTYRETEKLSNEMTAITMNNDVNNINDFLNIFIHPASKYQDYNSISFSYHRKEKLLQQLASLGSNLEGFKRPEIKGVPPSKQKEIEEKNREKLKKENNAIEVKQKISEITPVISDKAVESNVTVQSIIDKCITAMGGEDKLKAVENILEYGETEKSTYKMITAYGKFSYIGNYEGKSIKTLFDGVNGYSEYDGRKSTLNENSLSVYKRLQPFYILELKSRQDLIIGAIETILDKDYFTVIKPSEIISGTTYSTKLYFETDSGLYLGMATSNSLNNNVAYSFVYDYKEISGIKFPFTKINTYSDSSFTKTTITKITLNELLSDNDFK